MQKNQRKSSTFQTNEDVQNFLSHDLIPRSFSRERFLRLDESSEDEKITKGAVKVSSESGKQRLKLSMSLFKMF